MIANIASVLLAPLALSMTQVMAAPAAPAAIAPGNLTCVPKLSGKLFVQEGTAFDSTPNGLFYGVDVSRHPRIYDSQGYKESRLVSNNQVDRTYVFSTCDSEYMSDYKSTDDVFYGHLGLAESDPTKLSPHCLTTLAQPSELVTAPTNFTDFKTQSTNSINCFIDNESQAQRFFKASYASDIGGYRIQFVGAEKVSLDKYPGQESPVVSYERQSAGGDLLTVIFGGADEDRRRAVRRDDAGAITGYSLVLFGQPL